MPRYALVIEYDGSAFYGFQRQNDPAFPTVQRLLEEQLHIITRDKSIALQGCGRTDAGVHARGNVVHFESNAPLDPAKIRESLNFLCRPHVAVVDAQNVPADFHARFSCTARSYVYKIINRRAPSPTRLGRAAHVSYPLDVAAMQACLPHFIGEQDFSSFRATECQSSTAMCRLTHLSLHEQDDELHLHLTANHFLYNMVRIIAGTVVDVGRGLRPPESIPDLIAAKDRTQAGVTLPPDGLYFMKAHYDARYLNAPLP